MPDALATRRNLDPWWGLLVAVGAVLSNALFLVDIPGKRFLPWLGAAIALISILFLVRGLKRAFGRPQIYRGKVLSSVLAGISVLLLGLVGLFSYGARALPASASAPKVGEHAPDFTLTDTTGKAVSLGDLFAPAEGSQPKAVLLVFYRGYW
jgi:AhpC/TSA family